MGSFISRTGAHPRARIAAGIMVVAGVSLAGCRTPPPHPELHEVTFNLSEGKIVLDGTVTSGFDKIIAKNVGNYPHEIVFVRAASAASLPTMPDGSVNEDEIPATSQLGEIEDIAAGASGTKTIYFRPGHYVAFCNVDEDGHVHFASGMYLDFDVT
jgi:hypothetical protein